MKSKEAVLQNAKTRQILILRLLLNPGSQRSISIEGEKEREKSRERKRERDASSNPIYEANWWPGVSLNAVVLFSDIITPKGQMQQQYPSQSPFAKPRREDPSPHLSPRSGMEPEQSSLYRRHTKPFESWEPFFPFLPLCRISYATPLRSSRFLCLSLGTQLFSQLGILAQTILARSCARAREPMHRKPEPRRNLPPLAAVENVTSALSWGLTRESPQNAFGEARRMTGLRSAEASAKFTNRIAFDRKDTERVMPHENRIDYTWEKLRIKLLYLCH